MAVLKHILERIESKKDDYIRYNFTQTEDNALKTFFDLSQELDNIEHFYHLCVAIPKSFFDLEGRLYLTDPKTNQLALMATTEKNGDKLFTPPAAHVQPAERPYYSDLNSLVLSLRGKKPLIDQLPFETTKDILGIIEIYPVRSLDVHHELFFEKYANRVGFNLHNRFLYEKNIEHLRFIRTLVADIEHNVIAPNIVYRLFLRRLKAKIASNKELETTLVQYADKGLCDRTCADTILSEIREVNAGLSSELENFEKHYQNMSLFLEALLRRSHFDEGRLVLRTKPCNIKKDVVQPQLDRYLEQFKKAGISVDDRLSGIPDEEIISVVDVGIIAQVYANLFSNALKYTKEVVTSEGKTAKYISYGREIIKDYFGAEQDGIKYNVFSTGPHILPEEREKIFEEGYRGSDVTGIPGTGHGLPFIKNAVEIHGGVFGYEATQYGNNFYLILPKNAQ